MSRTTSQISWILPTLLLCGVSFLYFFEWRSSRLVSERLAARVTSLLEENRRERKAERLRVEAFLKKVRRDLESFSGALETLASATDSGARGPAGHPEPGEEADVGPAAPVEPADSVETENLPPLPDGLVAELEIRQFDFEKFFSDPRINPEGRPLSRLERIRAKKEIDTARAVMDVLESHAQLDVVKGMSQMRDRGDYVEYGRGEQPEPVMGVLTAGERTEDGKMRLFYFYPDEFPDIYEAKSEKKKVAQHAIQRLLSMVREEA